MSKCRLALVAYAVLGVSLPLLAGEVPEYREVREARPDGRAVLVRNLEIVRGAHQFRFTSGTFHFLRPAQGRTFGAIYVGEGSYELRPVSSERLRLRVALRDPDAVSFSDSFDHMVLLFTDHTEEEIARNGTPSPGLPTAGAERAYEDHLELQKSKLQINLHLRILRDLLAGVPPDRGVFIATVDGRKSDPLLAAVDPQGIGNLAPILAFFGGEEETAISLDEENGGVWYLGSAGARPGSIERGKALTPLAKATSYSIDTTISSNLSIHANATVDIVPRAEAGRVLPLNVLPKLRLRNASFSIDDGPEQPAAIIQEEVDLGRFRRLFQEEVADADAALVFPLSLPAGRKVRLRLEYEGNEVLRAAGPDSYSVRARESWYPNLGTFSDPASYELTFRFPRGRDLVATGVLQKEWEDKDQKVSVWKSPGGFRVAGFNYGRFEKRSRHDAQSGLTVDLYATRDFRKTAGDSIVDALNAVRIARLFYGESAWTPISVSQAAEWGFGQSWPTLIYLPTLALTTSTERVLMLDRADPLTLSNIHEFAKTVGWHEISHQWWGHQVGWHSYRDQWLSEGLAEFTAALVLQLTEDNASYNDYWERRREEILGRQGGTMRNVDAGPMSDGVRLSSRAAPRAFRAILYSKGAWVAQMLRRMMHDPTAANPDERFIAMMHDFVSTWSGKNPSTGDFQRVVEKHMTPVMNAAGGGSMSWFFDQWVFGTEIPKITSALTVAPLENGRYRIHGSVSQSEVSPAFRSIVPIYLDFGHGDFARLGQTILTGSSSRTVDVEVPFSRAPRAVVVNALQDLLTRN